MGKKLTLKLLAVDRVALMRIVARGANWRERERAQTLLILDGGQSIDETAMKIGIHARTVRCTREDWLMRRFESLVDRPRTGAPKKITPTQLENLVEAAKAAPLTAKALLAKHLDSEGSPVHLNTLKNALKTCGLVWKRTRHSLKKKGMNGPSEMRSWKLRP